VYPSCIWALRIVFFGLVTYMPLSITEWRGHLFTQHFRVLRVGVNYANFHFACGILFSIFRKCHAVKLKKLKKYWNNAEMKSLLKITIF